MRQEAERDLTTAFPAFLGLARLYFREPRLALDYFRGSERAYSQIASSEEISVVAGLIREADDTGLDATIERSVEVSRWGLEPAKSLYVLIRMLKPLTVVETGVAEGISSAYILKALSENGQGELYSIDIAELTETGETGYLVPEGLRGRWQLMIGASQQLLPELLGELRQIDFFLHDSDHSYEVMRFELEAAYSYLRRGGVLIADDALENHAFFDLCTKTGMRPVTLGWRMGAGRKQS